MGFLVRSAPIATTALLLLPGPSPAEEVQFGVRSGVTWADNVFGVSDDAQFAGVDEDPEDDVSFRITPSMEVKDRDGRVTWSLDYRPSYDAYVDFNELNGWDHVVGARFAWQLAPRWRLNLGQNFASYESATRFNQQADPGDQVAFGFRDFEVRTNSTTAELEHRLTERDVLSLTLRYNAIEYPDEGGIDRDIPAVVLEYRHLLDARTRVGADLSWRQQRFERRGSGRTDSTDFYNLAATLEHRFSQRFRLEASAGPTYIDSSPAEGFNAPLFGTSGIRFLGLGPWALNADSCEFDGVTGRSGLNFAGCALEFPNQVTEAEFDILAGNFARVATTNEAGSPIDDGGGSDLDYFARIALIREWEGWRARLAYRRSNSERARFGSSTVADTVTAALTFQPAQLWSVNLVGTYSIQEQSIDQAIPFAFQLVNAPPPPGVTSVSEVAQVESVIASTRGDEVEYTVQGVSVTLTRVLNRRSQAFAVASWSKQKQDFGPQDRTWNNLTFWIGVEWLFDPIRF